MLKIFKKSFSFRSIFSVKDEPLKKVIFYFIVLVLIISFPLNYQIFKNDGFSGLTQFTQELRVNLPLSFLDDLPNTGIISREGFSVIPDREISFEVKTETGSFTLILNPEAEIKEAKNLIVLDNDKTVYFNSKGESIAGNYSRINSEIRFDDLKNSDHVQARELFFSTIDSTFNKYGVFYSLLANTATQYLLNTFLIIVLASLMLFIKVNYEKVASFSDNLKIVIASMTIPSLLSFIASIINYQILNPFFVVIFQFLTPIIAVLAIYKGSKKPKSII